MNTKFVKLLALSVSCSLVAGVPPGSRALQRGRRDDDDDDGWDWDDDFWDDDYDYDYYYGISVDDGDRCAERDERCDDDTACCGSDSCFWLDGKDYGECGKKCPENDRFECYVPECAERDERCDDDTACCGSDSCFWLDGKEPCKDHGECHKNCPNDDKFECYVPTCVERGEDCSAGGGSYMPCCDSRDSCFWKDSDTAECRRECPDNPSWDCYVAPEPRPTPRPTPRPSAPVAAADSAARRAAEPHGAAHGAAEREADAPTHASADKAPVASTNKTADAAARRAAGPVRPRRCRPEANSPTLASADKASVASAHATPDTAARRAAGSHAAAHAEPDARPDASAHPTPDASAHATPDTAAQPRDADARRAAGRGRNRATPTPVAQPDEAESVDEEEEEDIDEEEEEDGDEEEEEAEDEEEEEDGDEGEVAEEPTRACPAIREADACPEEVDIAPCDAVGLVPGDFCEGDGECGTDRGLDNCAEADMYVVAGVGVDLVVVLEGVTAEEFRKTFVAERFADAVAAVLDVPPAAVGAPVAATRRRLQEAAARSCRVDFVVEVEEDRDVEADFARAVEAKALDDALEDATPGDRARGGAVAGTSRRRAAAGRRGPPPRRSPSSSAPPRPRPPSRSPPRSLGADGARSAATPDLESAASEEVKLDDEPSPYSPRLSWKTRKARLGRSFAWDDAAGAGWVSWARDDALGLQFVRRFDARGRLELVDARVGCAVGAADAATRLDLEDSGSWPSRGVAALRSTPRRCGSLADGPRVARLRGRARLGAASPRCLRLATSAIFATHFGLFKCAEGDALTYTVQDDAAVAAAVEGGARWLNFAGKLVGKALLDGAHLDAHLNRCLLKHVCGEPLSLVDLGWLDETLLKSLSQLRDIDVGGLELTFSVDESAFGAVRSRDLVEGGSSKAVTEANKEEFIELRLRDALFETSKEGIEAFLAGVYAVVPLEAFLLVSAVELELMLCGASELDVDSWMAHAQYRAVYRGDFAEKGADHDVVRWFWDAVRAMDAARSAHTCFNRIDLPLYEDPEKLAAAIKFVLEFGDETFSMD
ncbi:ubiquitin protein ligase [Aureococcus anophagefferens]|nr:ubiquitin protein ligase [Aureococcus anophagefferens]